MTGKYRAGLLNTFLGNSASLRPNHGLWKAETCSRKLFGGPTSLVQRLLALVKFERSRVVAMTIRANFTMLSPLGLDDSYQFGNDAISIEKTFVC